MRIGNKYRYLLNKILVLRVISTCLVSLLLTACGGVTGSQEIDNNKNFNMAIASALYFYVPIPDGFYSEDFQDDVFYSISHVNNTSILPMVDRAGLAVYELSSNDYVEALAWSEKASEYQPSNEQLTDISETALFYQFTRVDPASPQFIHIHRVFKSSMLDRTGVDRINDDDSYKGRITTTDLTVDNVKYIIEYLWTFTSSNNYQNAVLDSSTTETDDEFIHIIKQAKLDLSYSESCDTITVYEIRYTVSKSTGAIWKEKILTSEFLARRQGAYLEICK